MTAVAILHRDEIIQRIREGAILREIAADLGIAKQSISAVLKDDPEYQAAHIDQVESMIEHAKVETWAAREPHDIARAREMAKFAFRYAEAVNPAKWSPKREVLNLHADAGDWSDRLRRARERVISPDSHKDSHTAIEHSAQPVESKQDSA